MPPVEGWHFSFLLLENGLNSRPYKRYTFCLSIQKILFMKRVFLVFLFVALFFVDSIAQDILSDYKRAKTLVGYGNYTEAMDLLKPYMDKSQFGQLSNYASYNFAFAAYQNRQYELARTTIQSIAVQSNWDKSDDAKYLLSLTFFQEGKNKEALDVITTISDKTLKKEAENATFDFLKEAPLDFLLGNAKKYTENAGYRLALKSQLDRKTMLSSEERTMYAEINKSNNFDEVILGEKNKDILEIALLLPFNYSGGSGVRSLTSGNFVFELYQGILMGVEELKKSGVKVNMKTFDTARDEDKIRSILADPFMRQADIIIGPVYPEEVEVVMNFAETNKIPFINPLSNVNDKLQGMEFAYLFRPSVIAMADGVVDFARRNIAGKKIALAYSSSLRDEQLVKQIQETATKFNFEVIKSENVSGRSLIDFFRSIELNNNSNSQADLVVLLADDPSIASSALGFLESQNVNTPILVMDTWLYFSFANFEMLQSEDFYFIGNNTLKLGEESVDDFREKYFDLYTAYPTFNAHLGYELAYWLGSVVNSTEGFDFRSNLDKKGFWEGKISYGLNFKNSSSNQYVPVLKLEKGKLEIK